MSMAFDFSRLLSGYRTAAGTVRRRMSPAAAIATVDLCAVLVGVSVAHLAGFAGGPTLSPLAPTPPPIATSPVAAVEPSAPLPHLRPETVAVKLPRLAPTAAPDTSLMFGSPVVTDDNYTGDTTFHGGSAQQTSAADPISFTSPEAITTTAETDPPAPVIAPPSAPPADKIAAIALRGQALHATITAAAALTPLRGNALGRLDVAAAAGVDDTVNASANLEVASVMPAMDVGNAVGAVVTPVSAATTPVASLASAASTAASGVTNGVVGRVGGLLN